MSKFEHLGYFKEYYVNGRFIGMLTCEKDRDIIGYSGRTTEVTDKKITLDNRRVIFPATEVQTILYPLTGKRKVRNKIR